MFAGLRHDRVQVVFTLTLVELMKIITLHHLHHALDALKIPKCGYHEAHHGVKHGIVAAGSRSANHRGHAAEVSQA